MSPTTIYTHLDIPVCPVPSPATFHVFPTCTPHLLLSHLKFHNLHKTSREGRAIPICPLQHLAVPFPCLITDPQLEGGIQDYLCWKGQGLKGRAHLDVNSSLCSPAPALALIHWAVLDRVHDQRQILTSPPKKANQGKTLLLPISTEAANSYEFIVYWQTQAFLLFHLKWGTLFTFVKSWRMNSLCWAPNSVQSVWLLISLQFASPQHHRFSAEIWLNGGVLPCSKQFRECGESVTPFWTVLNLSSLTKDVETFWAASTTLKEGGKKENKLWLQVYEKR